MASESKEVIQEHLHEQINDARALAPFLVEYVRAPRAAPIGARVNYARLTEQVDVDLMRQNAEAQKETQRIDIRGGKGADAARAGKGTRPKDGKGKSSKGTGKGAKESDGKGKSLGRKGYTQGGHTPAPVQRAGGNADNNGDNKRGGGQAPKLAKRDPAPPVAPAEAGKLGPNNGRRALHLNERAKGRAPAKPRLGPAGDPRQNGQFEHLSGRSHYNAYRGARNAFGRPGAAAPPRHSNWDGLSTSRIRTAN